MKLLHNSVLGFFKKRKKSIHKLCESGEACDRIEQLYPVSSFLNKLRDSGVDLEVDKVIGSIEVVLEQEDQTDQRITEKDKQQLFLSDELVETIWEETLKDADKIVAKIGRTLLREVHMALDLKKFHGRKRNR